jgi:hypothetical protein
VAGPFRFRTGFPNGGCLSLGRIVQIERRDVNAFFLLDRMLVIVVERVFFSVVKIIFSKKEDVVKKSNGLYALHRSGEKLPRR